MPRLCSLVPSATEIVCALGLQDHLVGVSHECDFPAAARQKAILTRGIVDITQRSSAIDAGVRAGLETGGSLYALDVPLLERLRPDIILTQALCHVCAVGVDDVRRIAATLPSRPRVLSLDPHSLSGIMANVGEVAAACGVAERGEAVIAALRGRIDGVSARVAAARRRPRVVCLEWIDPPYCAGHWVPEMVALAGGAEWVGRCGGLSTRITWEDVAAADPDVVVVMCCGFSVERTIAEMATLRTVPLWASLRAVRDGQVYVTDGAAYFSRHGRVPCRGHRGAGSVLAPHALAPTLWSRRRGAPAGDRVDAAIEVADDGRTAGRPGGGG
ncbi:MAG: cobalamin-binding protein [Chloroflexota bacterium]